MIKVKREHDGDSWHANETQLPDAYVRMPPTKSPSDHVRTDQGSWWEFV